MSDEQPDLTEAAMNAARRASVHLVRAGRELWNAAAVALEEITKAFEDEDEGDRPHHVPVEEE